MDISIYFRIMEIISGKIDFNARPASSSNAQAISQGG
jgi:hypothetical protein